MTRFGLKEKSGTEHTGNRSWRKIKNTETRIKIRTAKQQNAGVRTIKNERTSTISEKKNLSQNLYAAIAKAVKHRRRAAEVEAEGSWTTSDIEALYLKQKGKCATCKAKIKKGRSASEYHIDHITPFKLGGSNWPSNLQLLCKHCNLTKNAKHPDVWAKENGLLFI